MQVVLKAVEKAYGRGGVPVLKNLDLTFSAGEICGVVGENGSGKSTLAKLLIGLERQDGGTIMLHDGAMRRPLSSDDVSYVAQDPKMVDDLDAVGNAYLGAERTHWILDDVKQQRDISAWETALFTLPAGEARSWRGASDRHRTSVIRAFCRARRVIVVDESTEPLDKLDVDKLHEQLRRQASEGKIVIFISHDLREVCELAQRIVALKDGRAEEIPGPPFTAERVRTAIFGVRVPIAEDKTPAARGRRLLALSREQPYSQGAPEAEVYEQEIVAFIGYRDSGLDAMFRKLSRPVRDYGPRWWWWNDAQHAYVDLATLSTAARRRAGIRYIPASRDETGLILQFDCAENFRLVNETARNDNDISDFLYTCGVAKPLTTLARELSGGNQQKLMVARELWPLSAAAIGTAQRNIAVAHNPTVGIDVASRDAILRNMRQFARERGAVVLLTNDSTEADDIADRRYSITRGGEIHEL